MIDASTPRSAGLPRDETIQRLIDGGELPRARKAIERRLKANADDGRAHFYRGSLFLREANLEAARDEFTQAQALQPLDATYLNAMAVLLLAEGKFEAAIEETTRALALAPNHVPSLTNHVFAHLKLKRTGEALSAIERLTELDPNSPSTRFLLAEALRAMGRFPAAFTWYEAALASTPEDPDIKLGIALCINHMGDQRAALAIASQLLEVPLADVTYFQHLGIRAQEGGSPHLALQFFKRGAILFPRDLTLLVNLGITLQAMGNPGEALFHFQHALAEDDKCEAAWFFGGISYQMQREPVKAAEYFEHCIEADPKHAQALTRLAWLRKDQGKVDDAKELLRKAIEHDPKDVQAALTLFNILKDERAFEEAEEILAEAEKVAGKDLQTLRHARADLILRQGEIAKANALFREILAAEPENPDAMSGLLFCSNYDPELTPEQIAEGYKSWDRRFAKWRAPAPDFKYPNKPDPQRRIKLGYVSGDLRGHSVAFFAEPLLANHNHEQFEVFCYANQKYGDATSGRMMKMADHWRWVKDLSDEALVEMIRLDGIDILVDLSNHTADHRLYMFSRKPAPIQMTTIGMPTTTGLSAIDWRITDAFMDPPGLTEHLHSEKLLRILSHWCYRPSDEAVDLPVTETPALKNGYLSFASFNAFGKINPSVITLWGRLLQEIPDALLYVATGGKDGDEQMEATVKATCEESGVPLDRLRLIGRKPFKEYCEFHQEIDVVLDSFPYTGATVTAHALWMGVPVITLAGGSPIHRSATSMMNSVGLPEFVAQTQDEYVEIAKRWAADIPGLAEIRRNLRPNMQKSPLMDGARVTRDLEEKLHQVWHDWCKENKPKRKRKITS